MSKTLLRFYGWFLYAAAVFFGLASMLVMGVWVAGLVFRALGVD